MAKGGLGALLLASALAIGCSSSSGYPSGYSGGYSYGGSGGSPGAGGATGNCINLTVLNYLSWCSVSIAGGVASSAASQTACVTPGAVSLSASPLTGFQLGTTPWHGVDGDQGSGVPGTVSGQTSTATATVNATKCVWVCCEFAGGGGCPTTNQCP